MTDASSREKLGLRFTNCQYESSRMIFLQTIVDFFIKIIHFTEATEVKPTKSGTNYVFIKINSLTLLQIVDRCKHKRLRFADAYPSV